MIMKTTKKLMSTLLAVLMIFTLINITPAQAAEFDMESYYRQAVRLVSENWSDNFVETISLAVGQPYMEVDGYTIPLDASPTLVDGRTMLPIRALIEQIGGEVSWDGIDQIISIEDDGDTITLQINSNTMYYNDEAFFLDVAPIIIDDRTMLPVRAVSESLGFQVDWEPATQSITLTRDFQTKRLIVKTSSKIEFDFLNPEVALEGPDNITILQFDTMTETYIAFGLLSVMGGVIYVEPDLYVQGVENQPVNTSEATTAYNSWGIERIGADKYAEYLRLNGKTQEVTVAVLDTGVDASHTFLSGRVRNDGWNFINGNSNTNDVHGHGTHVSGTIVDATPGLNVRIMPVKVLSDSGSGTYLGIADGIRYAADAGVEVINMSLGGQRSGCSLIDERVLYATSRGVTVVVAAGNDSSDSNNYCPAHIGSAITVAAVDRTDRTASFTNYGSVVDVAAPGVDIVSSIPGNRYASYNGTSMASPHVAAAAAMYILDDPTLTPAEVENKMKTYYDVPTNWNSSRYHGVGIVNMELAIDSTNPTTISLTPSTNHTFPAATVGYQEQSAHTVTVSNTGTAASGALSIALSGANASDFTLNKTTISNINANGSDTFTVTPRTGLAVGTYTATVSVTGSSIPSGLSFMVSFTVNSTSSGDNTDFAGALPIYLNTAASVNIGEPNERRFYLFTAPSSGTYTFQSSNNGYNDPVGWLYDANESLLDYNDDFTSLDYSNLNYRISYALNAGQQVYIVGGMYWTGTGNYSLTVTTTSSGDNTTFAGALPISLNSPVSVGVTASNQRRYYTFTAPTAGVYLFQSSNRGSSDPYGYLYNSNQSLLTSNDDYNDLNFRISYSLTAGQQVYIAGGCYASGTGSYTLTVTSDTTSGNTDFSGALPISLNTPVSVSVTASGQKRYYTFTAPSAGTYTFESSSRGNSDPYGYLYNSSQSLIASNDDGGESLNFRIQYSLSAGQQVYIAGGCYSSQTGSYTMTVTVDTSNTSFGGALPITLNTSVSVSVTASYQKRYYTFTAPSAGTYIFESTNNGSSDPYGWLYNSSQSELTYNDDSGSGYNFRISYALSAGQQVYIAAGCFSSSVGSYTISVTSSTSDGNTSFGGALPIALNSAVSVSVTQANQRRYYLFTAPSAGTYTFQSSNNTNSDPYGYLYNSSQSLIASNDDGAGSLNFRITQNLTAGQQVYIVGGCFSSNTGSYTMMITGGSTNDGNTSFGTALPIALNSPVTVSVTASSQRRYYSFTAPNTGTYVFQSSSSGYSDPYGYLYNSNQVLLSSNDDGAGYPDFRISYSLSAGQQVYIAGGCYGSGTGSYSITITGGSTSDGNTSFSTALPISLNSPVSVTVTAASQRRYYLFTAPSAGSYVFESSGNTNSDPYGYLYNANQSLLTSNDDYADSLNFRITQSLTAGQQVYIAGGCYGSNTGNYTLTVSSNTSNDNTSFAGALPISVNSPVSVSITASGQKRYYLFTAPSTGTYVFESSNNGVNDPTGFLYSSNQGLLVSNDDADFGSYAYDTLNFRISYYLSAGQQVYIAGGCYSTGTGSYTISISG